MLETAVGTVGRVASLAMSPAYPGGAVSVAMSSVAGIVGEIARTPARSAAAVVSLDGGTAKGSGLVEGGGEGGLLETQRLMQQESFAFSSQYLQMQDAMQRESRQFNAVSNVMKVRHDSAKAAINNIR